MKKLIFDPLEEYRDNFKPKHVENTKNLFDELLTKSRVNVDENQLTVKKIKELDKNIKIEEKTLNGSRGSRSFLIFLIIAFFLLTVFFIAELLGQTTVTNLAPALLITFALLGVVLAVLLIFFIVKKINPKIKIANEVLTKLKKDQQHQIEIAWTQVNSLLSLFDNSMSAKLLEKTVPLLEMDDLFDSKRFDYLNRKYGLAAETDFNQSTLFVQSGVIQGNPFLLSKARYMDMGTKTYSGSKTVVYTVTVYRDGKAVRQTRTEVLTAYVTKPCPYYNDDTVLIYGNEAAPNLTFNRYPKLSLDWTPNSLKSLVNSEEKEMKNIADKALKNGRQFMPLGNSEFEALFNAYNRDNEVEYRLLFTPLGQSEILDLIKDKTVGFGDDFEFHKSKNLNIIRSKHSQLFDYSGTTSAYKSYDVEDIRQRFINYNTTYFRNFYFNVAPVLAVPLYQQQKPVEFIYKQDYRSFLSFYEHEATANAFPESTFAHPDSVTNNIVKTSILKKGSDHDLVQVTSQGFRTEQRVDYVTKIAGNGSAHSVPVYWQEYLPVSNTEKITVKILDKEFENKAKTTNFFDRYKDELSKYTNNKEIITGKHVMAFIALDKFNENINLDLNTFLKENIDK